MRGLSGRKNCGKILSVLTGFLPNNKFVSLSIVVIVMSYVVPYRNSEF